MEPIDLERTLDAICNNLPVSDLIRDEIDGEAIAEALTAAGWTYTGNDTHLVNKLLNDPYRNLHILDLTETGWALQHPLIERIDGNLFICAHNARGERFEQAFNVLGPGKYLVADIENEQIEIQVLPEPHDVGRPRTCPKCQGDKQIANSEDGEPWSAWANLPPGSDLAVRVGLVKPIDCPECNGTGTKP